MRLTEQGRRDLLAGAHQLGLNLAPFIAQFESLLGMLTTANQTTNLTAIREESEIIRKHFLDSLSCLLSNRFDRDSNQRVIDVGTGAGFPGLPLAIVQPTIQLDLLDATRKKVEFVTQAIAQLGLLNARAIWGRAEDLAHQPGVRESYDGAVTRAVSSLSVVAELCLPLVRVGGFVLIQKGMGIAEELAQAEKTALELGGFIPPPIPIKLPLTQQERTLIVIEKNRSTPPKYPRKAGIPAKNPLF